MRTQDELDRRLERFYLAVRGEVPATPPAWLPERRARGGFMTPVLAAAALAVFAIGLALAFRQLHQAQRVPAGVGQTAQPSVDYGPNPAVYLSLGAVRPDGMWIVRRSVDNRPPSAGGVPTPAQNVLEVTTDGGRTWQSRLQFGSGYDGMSWAADGRAAVLWTIDWTPTGCTNSSGKVACPAATNAMTVYGTTDGGLHWSRHEPTSFPARYVYFRGIEGWVLARSIKLGLGPDDLYHTSDGGQTWSRIAAMPHTGERMSSTSGVGEDSLEFLSSQVGWFATGQPARPGDSGLFLTIDGGRTWSSQSVQPPAAMAGRSMTLGYPQLVGGDNALLPVIFGPGTDRNNPATGEHYVYSSADGGITWASPVPLRSGLVKPMGSEYEMFYLDSKHWWFTANNDHPADSPVPKIPQAMARTTDGGRTWQVFETPAIFQIMFNDPSNGWAEAEAKVGQGYENILLRTTDGGAHWQQVQVTSH